MKRERKNSHIQILYEAHHTHIINKEDKNYLKLFEHFYDLLSNVNNNNLRESILFSYIEIENLLFNYVECTSKNFYELGFNDLKAILFSNSTINNKKDN